jgi:para-nitrobenzyl esterase
MLSRRRFLAAAALSAAAPAFSASAPPVVTTTLGRIRGTRESGLCVFRGIRYGVAERFRAPASPPASRDLFDAAGFAPSAPQRGERYRPHDEDCLSLNIWTPEASPARRRPVMVYFHGGAYSSGSVADPLNDGRHLCARGDMVAITVNHRLNAFGYLYLARLDPRFPDSGNAGQLDLILALRWIRDNVARFGGDPGRIMLFGQSGGGAKIATLMAMPAAAGLFHRAATMSGQQVTASGPLHATSRARAFLRALRAGSVAELLSRPIEALVEGLGAEDPILGGGLYFGPVLDMRWLARHPFWPDAPPQSHLVPMILGNTRDETRGFFGPDHPKIAGLSWENLAERLGPELRVDIHPEWVVAEYRRLFPEYTPEQTFFAATTAGRSWRGQVEEADARARAGARTWVYRLDFASPVDPWRGAPHMLDIPLVFGTLDAPGSIAGTGADSRRIAAAMTDSFIAMARDGNPNHAGLPDWPEYRLPERQTMIFDSVSRAEADPRRAQRELFARVPYVQPGT